MPFDLSTRPNPLGLTEAQFALWDELLAWLDTGGDDACRFDYSEWHETRPGCGTIACIGGWLEMRMFGESDRRRPVSDVSAVAGLVAMTQVGHDLFHGALPSLTGLKDTHGIDRYPTAAEAAACVRVLLAEGVVDWPRAMGAA